MGFMVDYNDLSHEEKKRLITRMSRELENSEGQSKLNTDDNKITPGQVKYLRGLGYKGDPLKLSKLEASEKIKELTGGK